MHSDISSRYGKDSDHNIFRCDINSLSHFSIGKSSQPKSFIQNNDRYGSVATGQNMFHLILIHLNTW